MKTTFDPLLCRRILGREKWSVPMEWDSTGWRYLSIEDGVPVAEILVSTFWPVIDGETPEWRHASMVRQAPAMPSYDDLCLLKRAVWGDLGFAYQVFPSADEHVNVHSGALHLWGRADYKPALPDFRVLNPDSGRLEI